MTDRVCIYKFYTKDFLQKFQVRPIKGVKGVIF